MPSWDCFHTFQAMLDISSYSVLPVLLFYEDLAKQIYWTVFFFVRILLNRHMSFCMGKQMPFMQTLVDGAGLTFIWLHNWNSQTFTHEGGEV